MDFWERIKSQIKAQGTTQEWVATRVGVAPETFRRWMSKKIMPNADQAFIIGKSLGCTVEYLVAGEDNTDPWLRENAGLIKKLKSLNDVQIVHIGSIINAWDALNKDAAQRAGAS